ncbi:MAG: glycerate kinase family protein [Culicoidibacterales bacterium]
MKYVIACDSFKGSITSSEANELIKNTIQEVSKYNPDIYTYQLSDGGEGFLNTVQQYYTGGDIHSLKVHNAIGQMIEVKYYCKNYIAYIESAEAIGIEKVNGQLDITKATSYGLGEILEDAYQKGIRNFVVGLGGSATSDMGLGVLQALGCVLKDEQGKVLDKMQNNQFHTYVIIKSALFEKIQSCTFTIINDVEGTLLGPNGAAMMFSKQKGATSIQQKKLEEKARKIVDLYNELGGEDKRNSCATAAAGGLGYFFQSLFQSENKMGSHWFMECSGIKKVMTKDAILITGEGSIDEQTLQGKGPGVIAGVAKKQGLFVIGVAGKIFQKEGEENSTFDALFSIQSEPRSLTEAMEREVTQKQLRFTIRQLIALIER